MNQVVEVADASRCIEMHRRMLYTLLGSAKLGTLVLPDLFLARLGVHFRKEKGVYLYISLLDCSTHPATHQCLNRCACGNENMFN